MPGWLGLAGFVGLVAKKDVIENEGLLWIGGQICSCTRGRFGGEEVAERQVSGNGTRFVWYTRGVPGLAWVGVPGGEGVSVDGRWCSHILPILPIAYGIRGFGVDGL
jgi:hypothetical protein